MRRLWWLCWCGQVRIATAHGVAANVRFLANAAQLRRLGLTLMLWRSGDRRERREVSRDRPRRRNLGEMDTTQA
jgi:hypothetical protein